MPPKAPSIIIIDCKTYTGRNPLQAVKHAVYLVHGDASGSKVNAFTSRPELLKWLKGKPYEVEVQALLKNGDTWSAKFDRMTPAEVDAFGRTLKPEVDAAQKKYASILKTAGVAQNDSKGILKLAAAGKFGSMILYNGSAWTGSSLYLPAGNYPRLSAFGWNDRANSVINLSATRWGKVYYHANYHGFCWIFPPLTGTATFWPFNNTASSVKA